MSDNKFIREFLHAYRSLPALWDTTSKDYNNRGKKADQYEILLQKYREKFPDATKLDVVRKINSLRTNFRKELKRVRDSEDATPSLWYFEDMVFLTSLESSSRSIDRNLCISTMDPFQETHALEEVFSNDDCGDSISETSFDRVRTNHVNHVPLKKRRSQAQNGDHIDDLIQLAAHRLQQPQDEVDKVCAVWATELRNMDPQQQLLAKKAINDVLFEGRMGTLHRNSLQINPIRVQSQSHHNIEDLPPSQ